VFRVYELKYTSAPVVADFLKKAAPEVEAISGPEYYNPPRGTFQPLTTALRSAAGGTSGQGGSAGGAGMNQGSAGQTQGGGAGASQTREKEGDRSKVIVLKGPEANVVAALRLLESIDTRPQQVMVEVKVIETSPNLTDKLGMDWSWTPFRFFEVKPGTAASGIEGINFKDFTTKPTGLGQFSRAPWSFQNVLNAMITKGEAKVLASPSVQTVDNGDANVFIGDTIRARVAQANGLGGQTVDVIEFPVGIILLIRPRINSDGMITMHVNPVVSTVTDIGADNIPQTSSREAETTVIVKDGESMVIGGLIRDEYSKIVSQVPFLSQLPVVGQLFRNRTTTHKRTDVVVTITPHIIKDKEK
jgi:type II secretory pathway component GspD/PulD (secretin)